MRSRAPRWVYGLAALALASSFACGRDNSQQATTSSSTPATTTAANNTDNPDWWTTTKVQAKFFADDTVKGRDINVDTNNGVVTLTGTVDSEEAKSRAGSLARGVEGVSAVNNNLTVGTANANNGKASGNEAVATAGHEANSVAATVEPAWITTKIQAQYFADPNLKPWNIDVTTMSNGTVTLNGDVDSADAKAKAETIARNTDGVKNVDNRLRVTNGGNSSERPINQPDAWLTAKVQAKFYADDLVKGRDIDVDTKDGVVTLNGSVGSTTERDQADALARSTDGVKDVKDNLTVEVTPASAHVNPVRQLPELNRVGMDSWITTKIRSRFFIDPNVKNMNVDVSTKDGVVTLTGQVQDQNAKTAAESIAKHIDGVKKVNNELTVKQ